MCDYFITKCQLRLRSEKQREKEKQRKRQEAQRSLVHGEEEGKDNQKEHKRKPEQSTSRGDVRKVVLSSNDQRSSTEVSIDVARSQWFCYISSEALMSFLNQPCFR